MLPRIARLFVNIYNIYNFCEEVDYVLYSSQIDHTNVQCSLHKSDYFTSVQCLLGSRLNCWVVNSDYYCNTTQHSFH